MPEPKGLYDKYKVMKRGVFGIMTEKKTPSFVVSPEGEGEYGEASRAAVKAYADSIRAHNEVLAKDLDEWLSRIAITFEQQAVSGALHDGVAADSSTLDDDLLVFNPNAEQ